MYNKYITSIFTSSNKENKKTKIMRTFTAATEGQKVKFNELKGFYNVSTSSIEKIASNWGFNAQEIHKLCESKNPEVFITLDKGALTFTSKNFQAFFTDNDFLFNNMK